MLHIADLLCVNGAIVVCEPVAIVHWPAAKVLRGKPCVDGRLRRWLNMLERVIHAANDGQVTDLPQQLRDDYDDDDDGYEIMADATLFPICSSAQNHDADQAGQKCSDESCEHVLGCGVLDEHLRGAWRRG